MLFIILTFSNIFMIVIMTWHINYTPTNNLQCFAWARVSTGLGHGPVRSDGSRLTEISERIERFISEFCNNSMWLFGYFESVSSLIEITMGFVEPVTFALSDPFPRVLGEGSTCICRWCKVRYFNINPRDLEYYRSLLPACLKGNHQKLVSG